MRCLSAAFRVRFQSSFVRQSPVMAAHPTQQTGQQEIENTEHIINTLERCSSSSWSITAHCIFRSVQGVVVVSQCQGRCSLCVTPGLTSDMRWWHLTSDVTPAPSHPHYQLSGTLAHLQNKSGKQVGMSSTNNQFCTTIYFNLILLHWGLESSC